MLRRTLRTLAALLLSLPLFAEGNCGEMMRTVTRFRGKVLSVAPIGKEPTHETLDYDEKVVVTVAVEGVREESSPLKIGAMHRLGVLSAEGLIGANDFEAEWMQCDGAFRRLLSIRPLPPRRIVETFDGSIELGHSYRATGRWDDGKLVIEPWVDLPMHHSGGIVWSNLDAFRDLPRGTNSFPLVFEARSVEISHIGERHWLSVYELELVDVEARDRRRPR